MRAAARGNSAGRWTPWPAFARPVRGPRHFLFRDDLAADRVGRRQAQDGRHEHRRGSAWQHAGRGGHERRRGEAAHPGRGGAARPVAGIRGRRHGSTRRRLSGPSHLPARHSARRRSGDCKHDEGQKNGVNPHGGRVRRRSTDRSGATGQRARRAVPCARRPALRWPGRARLSWKLSGVVYTEARRRGARQNRRPACVSRTARPFTASRTAACPRRQQSRRVLGGYQRDGRPESPVDGPRAPFRVRAPMRTAGIGTPGQAEVPSTAS